MNLEEEMTRSGKSLTAAALALADKIAGHATAESKARRLAAPYSVEKTSKVVTR